MRIGEWAQLDLQSIQHRDYFGHLSVFHPLGTQKSAKTPLPMGEMIKPFNSAQSKACECLDPDVETEVSCENLKPTKKCKNWKNQGKCNKNWAKEKCAKTCGEC